MKKILRTIPIILIINIVMTYTSISIATNKTELQNEKSDLSNSINQAQEQLEDIKEKKSETLSQVEDLMGQISEYQEDIDELTLQISNLKNKINDAEEKIKEDEEEYKRQQENLNKRLVTMYENGDTSYLSFILSSKSLYDFLSNYYIISKLTSYDTEILRQVDEEKQKIENEKLQLENDKQSLDNAKSSKETKASALKVAKKEKEAKASKLSDDEKATQNEIQEMLEDKAQIDKELKKIAEQEAAAAAEAAKKAQKNKQSGDSSGSVVPTSPSSAGYIFPVAGCSKSNIGNLSFPSYSGHTGIDINRNVTGKNVLAVKAGTVVTSTALRNPNGTYRSYGEYVIINHEDGTMTLYAHMLAGSRKVQAGQKVSQGQTIGIVGSTGNSTGTHLHFEVRVLSGASGSYSYKAVNPLSYLP